MRTDINVVHVIFKTHLDVGFTDFARNVVDRYMNHFIPDAITLAQEMQQYFPEEPFRWTVGSWLIYEYLERATPAQRQQMEAAIRDDLVAWHGVPFTTHTELMDETLFRYGLSLSRELDKRYGKETISAKMTDVPGHTRAMIPLLAEAGIRFFHIGTNAASTVPDVPPVFIWRDIASNTEIIMMYQHVYGDVMVIPGTKEALAIIFTGDNLGPPSKDSVRETYAALRAQFPNARFLGSTLDNVARSIMAAQLDLPVITSEIGDTWIHGIGTDPTKVSQYRELLHLRDEWTATQRIDEVYLKRLHQALIMIPEHTWGMDLKTHLRDYEHYDTQALARVRSEPNFSKFAASWQEQRDYITDALNALDSTPLKAEAENRLQSIQPRRPDLATYQVASENHFETSHWSIEIDSATGAIENLIHKVSGVVLADKQHPLSLLTYETFSSADFDRYWQQYIRNREDPVIREWAMADNMKLGLQVEDHQLWLLTVENIYQRSDADGLSIVIKADFHPDSQQIGAPQKVYLEYLLAANGQLEISVSWFNKPACRLPEAFWMSFKPLTQESGTWAIHKLGSTINPRDVVSNGARTLHGSHGGVSYREGNFQLNIDSFDAPLVAPGKPSLLDFHNQLPDMTGGMHFNLYNNIWGTNFPMWFEDDARFRFVISVHYP
jgi:hypothetical protein